MPIVVCPNCGAKNRVDDRAQRLQPVCGRCGAKLAAPTGETEAPSEPIILTDATIASELRSAGDVPVLVDAWAPWCGPCRMIAPAIEQLAAEAAGRYRVAKLNVDDNPQTATRFRIDSIPTLLIFKNGNVVDRIVGLQSKQVLAERILQYAR